jgi:hypothetical protein
MNRKTEPYRPDASSAVGRPPAGKPRGAWSRLYEYLTAAVARNRAVLPNTGIEPGPSERRAQEYSDQAKSDGYVVRKTWRW